MKKIILFLTFFTCFWILGQTPSNDPHWQLLWEDNFNSFDANKWLKVDWAQHGEPQLYLANNVTVSNGNLVIKVNNNPTYCPTNPPTVWGACWPCANQWYNYTSGWVETKQSYNTQFGYIESRIKLPYGYGFWPAFWTFIGSGVNGSNVAEIDIFEMLGHQASNIVGTNLHKAYCDCDNYKCNQCFLYDQQCPDYDNTILCYGQDLTFSNFTYTDWHKYGIEWTPSKIIWYIDDFPVRTTSNVGIIDPVRIILNLAIEPGYLPNSSTPFPSEMIVDYVKAYKLKNDCNTIINNCNFNFLTYENKIKKEITIGGNGCINSIPNSTFEFLRATDGILIKGDFTVPTGSQLLLEVNPCY